MPLEGLQVMGTDGVQRTGEHERGNLSNPPLIEGGEPEPDRCVPSPARERHGVGEDQVPRTVAISGGHRVAHRGIGVPAFLEPVARPLVHGLESTGVSPLELLSQQLGEEVVVLIPMPFGIEGDDEEAPRSSHVLEQGSAVVAPEHGVAKRPRHPLEDAGLPKERHEPGIDEREHFLGQVLSEIAVSGPQRHVRCGRARLRARATAADAKRGELETRRPSLGPLVELAHDWTVDSNAHLPEHRLRLLEAQAQV